MKIPLKDRPKRAPKTIKEKAFVKEYLSNGGNKVQAALKVYETDNYNSASTIAAENVQKLTIPDLMNKMGLTDEALIASMSKGLFESMKVVGTPNDFVEVEDYGTRHRYLETALKVKKILGPDVQLNQMITVKPILGDLQANIVDGDE